MLKRTRDVRDLPRSKRLYEASLALLKRDWVQKAVVFNPEQRIKRRPDGTFSLRICEQTIIRKEHVEEILNAVSTDTEPAYVQFKALENGQMEISIETSYPAESAIRRESRKDDADSWWRHLDLMDKKSEVPSAISVWSNELLSISEYDRKCIMFAHRTKPSAPMSIQFVKTITKLPASLS
jgi:hypothetical protein